jgi:SpoIID/LytB domain protein
VEGRVLHPEWIEEALPEKDVEGLAAHDLGDAARAWAAGEPGKPRVGTVTGLAIAERSTASGRVTVVELRHRLDGKTQTLRIPAGDLRLAYGPGRIRSTWWTGVTPAKDGVAIIGKGFGHGVGLCQHGAMGMARAGHDHPAILGHYYPGSTLRTAW